MFSWTNLPDTQHPGEDYGCRCNAVPYIRGQTEFAAHDFGVSLENESQQRWSSIDMWRNSRGAGRDLALREIGHLKDIVEQYAYLDGENGALARLSEQIIVSARLSRNGKFDRSFSGSYDFRDVAYAHGHSIVRGTYEGSVTLHDGYFKVDAVVQFEFRDVFTDPFDIRQWINRTSDPEEVSETWRGISDIGGHVFSVTDTWSTRFSGEARIDEHESKFKNRYGRTE